MSHAAEYMAESQDGHVDTGPLETFYQHEYWYNPNTDGGGG